MKKKRNDKKIQDKTRIYYTGYICSNNKVQEMKGGEKMGNIKKEKKNRSRTMPS